MDDSEPRSNTQFVELVPKGDSSRLIRIPLWSDVTGNRMTVTPPELILTSAHGVKSYTICCEVNDLSSGMPVVLEQPQSASVKQLEEIGNRRYFKITIDTEIAKNDDAVLFGQSEIPGVIGRLAVRRLTPK